MHYRAQKVFDSKKYLRKSPNTIAYIARKGYNGKQGEWTFFYILIQKGFKLRKAIQIYFNDGKEKRRW